MILIDNAHEKRILLALMLKVFLPTQPRQSAEKKIQSQYASWFSSDQYLLTHNINAVY